MNPVAMDIMCFEGRKRNQNSPPKPFQWEQTTTNDTILRENYEISVVAYT